MRTWSSRNRRRLHLEHLEDRTVPTIVLPMEGVPGPITLTGTPRADAFVVRLQEGGAATLEVSDDGGRTFRATRLALVTGINVDTGRGKDTLTISHRNGLVAKTDGLPITYAGGPGHDVLVLTGGLADAVGRETYTVGDTADAGLLTLSSDTASSSIRFTGLSALLDLTPAASLTINQNDNANLVRLERGRSSEGLKTLKVEGVDTHGLSDAVDGILDDGSRLERGIPSRESFVPITLANKTAVTINTLGGDDLILLDNARPVTGLTSLTIDGGAGTDRLRGNDVPAGATLTVLNVESNRPDANEDVFLQQLYVDRLHRSASEAEVEGWRAVLNGLGGQTAVVQAVEGSLEARARLVDEWYRHFLGRPAGLETAVAVGRVLQAGVTEEQFLNLVTSSAEFRARASTDDTVGTADDRFVRALFSRVLGREDVSGLDVSGLSGLVPTLGAGVLSQAFLASDEYRLSVVDGLYEHLLEREADVGGRAFWAESTVESRRIREVFESTDEFFDDRRTEAVGVALDATGQLRLEGTSANQDDERRYQFTAPAVGTVAVTVQTTNGVFAKVEIEDGAGNDVFETEPNDGQNAGRFSVRAGVTYFVKVEAPRSSAAVFVVTLTFGASTGGDGGTGGGGTGGGSTGGDNTAAIVREIEPNNEKSQATPFTLAAGGSVRLEGVSANNNERDFFAFTPAQGGTLEVSVTTTNGVFADLEIEDPASNSIFETEPNDGINAGRVAVAAGVRYTVRLRSHSAAAAAYAATLVLR